MKTKAKYLIIGSGRLARHFSFYFGALGLDTLEWARSSGDQNLRQLHAESFATLLLISDSALCEFVDQHPFLREKPLVHCSGSAVVPGVQSFHPLMSFLDPLYDLDLYSSIPFVCERGQYGFDELFPSLPNPHYELDSGDRARYHAWSTLAANALQLVVGTYRDVLESAEIPAQSLITPYFNQVFKNALEFGPASLTGAIARGDDAMKAAHRAVLGDFEDVYNAFEKIHHERAKD